MDEQFFHVLTDQYRLKISQHQLGGDDYKSLPKQIRDNMDLMKGTPEYNQLIGCIAQWFALMELCEDLLERIALYGITQYFDLDALLRKLHKNWMVKQKDNKSFE